MKGKALLFVILIFLTLFVSVSAIFLIATRKSIENAIIETTDYPTVIGFVSKSETFGDSTNIVVDVYNEKYEFTITSKTRIIESTVITKPNPSVSEGNYIKVYYELVNDKFKVIKIEILSYDGTFNS